MNELMVRHLSGDRIGVLVRGHEIVVDQPIESGGGDAGPTPVELFVAGLATCVAHYAHGYLHRHHLPEAPIEVLASWAMATSPARVAEVELDLRVSPDVPPERLDGLYAVASRCTVHNSLTSPPAVRLRVSTVEADAA